VWWQQLTQRLGRALGLQLLHVRQRRVQQDHRDDRDRQCLVAARRRERGRHPQQQRQRVHELTDEFSNPAALRGARDLVATELRHAPLGLTRRQTGRPRAQMCQQHVDPLLRIDDADTQIRSARPVLPDRSRGERVGHAVG